MTERKLTVGNLVDLLFKTIMKENGRKYSTQEVALMIGMTDSTVRAIRYSVVGNPGIQTLIPIAHFFKVSLDYFDAKNEQEALALIAQSRGTLPQVERWAYRMGHLSETAQHDVLRMVEWIERAELLTRYYDDDEAVQDEDDTVFTPES